MRIFLSYGHDEHADLAIQLKRDLEGRGHNVWFDLDRLKSGEDWEAYIEDGLNWVSSVPGEGRFVLLMTPYSVRRPNGYCLNEISRALQRQLAVIPLMVVRCESLLSICRLQWLDMRDCVPLDNGRERYFLIPVRLDDSEPSFTRLKDIHRIDLFPDWEHTGLLMEGDFSSVGRPLENDPVPWTLGCLSVPMGGIVPVCL